MSKYFFIGIAGVGMSAIAQYLNDTGDYIYGSDRLFVKNPNHVIRQKLEAENIKTYKQGEAVLDKDTDFVVVSTAIEKSVPEYQMAIDLNIPIIHRSEMLKKITQSKKTIAIAGTSGKSSTTAMLYTILDENNFSPSMLNGSGLVSLQEKQKIGNSAVGQGDWLVIEADESDGSLINYTPEIGVILNIDRDHKEYDELKKIFAQFGSQTTEQLIVNQSNRRSAELSNNSKFDFGTDKTNFCAKNVIQQRNGLYFSINNVQFFIPAIGLHNVENATCAIAVANYLGIDLENIAKALKKYKGIERRMQIVDIQNDTIFIDDYAHNPTKIKSAIKSAQVLGNRVFAFFQPHGFTPLKFMKDELIENLKQIMRKDDEFYLADVFYAGGTVSKTITSVDVVAEMQNNNISAHFLKERNNFATEISEKLQPNDVVLMMGARDPSLKEFSAEMVKKCKQI